MNASVQSAQQLRQVKVFSEAEAIRFLEGRDIDYAPYRMTLRELTCKEDFYQEEERGGQICRELLFKQYHKYYMWVAVPIAGRYVSENWMVRATAIVINKTAEPVVANVPRQVFGNPLEAPIAQKIRPLRKEFVQVSNFMGEKLLIPSNNLKLKKIREMLKENYNITPIQMLPRIFGNSSLMFVGVLVREKCGDGFQEYIVNCFNLCVYYRSGVNVQTKIPGELFTREIPLASHQKPVIWDGMAVRYNSDTDTVEVQMLS